MRISGRIELLDERSEPNLPRLPRSCIIAFKTSEETVIFLGLAYPGMSKSLARREPVFAVVDETSANEVLCMA